jgi:MFS family permease
MLTLVYTLSYLDRGLVALLLQPIKEDLGLSDAQLGFLTGIAFGLFYATLGLPIARWADRGNRVSITSIAIAVWSMTVMACTLVTNFTQLVIARVMAAVGESGCMPPSYSLVGDYFPEPEERTKALTIYMLAGSLASLISFVGGGWLCEQFGWRATFVIMGAPALVVAFIVKKTVIEPRSTVSAARALPASSPRVTDVVTTLWRKPSARHLIIALILLFTMGSGLAPWYAAFMTRSHGLSTGDLGIWMGMIFGFGGLASISLGGYISNRWFSGDERGQMRLSAVMTALLIPSLALFLLLPSANAALLALLVFILVCNFFIGPTFAVMQRLVTAETRATTLAVVMLLANIIGMGVGPLIVGLLSDLLSPTLGKDSLRYAMFAMSFLGLWGSIHFWLAGRTIKADLSSVTQSIAPPDDEFERMFAKPTLAK